MLCERNLSSSREGIPHDSSGPRLFSYGSADPSVHMPLRELLAALRGERGEDEALALYAAQTPIDELGPALRHDIIVPPYCGLSPPPSWSRPASVLASVLPRGEPTINVWLGGGGTVSPLHTDSHHNLLFQVAGTKNCVLFDPETCTGALAVRDNASALGLRGELLGEEGVDMGVFPEFATSKPLTATIRPGDALYIPAGFWHHIAAADGGNSQQQMDERCQPGCFSVNFWWH